jgi:hypothetical protein
MLKSERIRSLVSKDKKIIFLWTPKSGCTTVKYIFYNFIGVEVPKDNIMKVHYLDLGHFYNRLPKNHEEYLKIQFVRNPYEKCVSGFLTHKQHEKFNKCKIIKKLDFNDFLIKIKNESLIDCKSCYFHNQSQLMTNKIDEIIKIENLFCSIDSINKKYKINLNKMSYQDHSYKKQFQTYESFFSKENIEIINEIYHKDIDFFNYKKL